ncbi:MAG: FAD-binding oxidoreductase [Nitrospinae bacterium CG11_big_fil_rev_8_21_14_0_20_56_8]|nr:MAG: FAD-binding oxidoreductase [Nitrospinae bacterium CG11_big_fil_rev_8_21_14_0_20_56_8]
MIRKTGIEEIAPYLKDASNFSAGCAEEVVIPESAAEIADFLKNDPRPVTVAGAGTGLTASRIPASGVILSVERLNRMDEVSDGTIVVQPAVRLIELQKALMGTAWFYPPNPTESLAFIGGTVATNASGSRSYKFGATRKYVREADVVLADGRTVTLARGLTIDQPLTLDDGFQIQFPEVAYTSPQFKNAAGYFIQPGMDWLDLFIGSDGTLGIFTRLQLKLMARPADFLSGVLFFDHEESSWELVDALHRNVGGILSPCSLEYFDRHSLQRLRTQYGNIPQRAQAALFFEQDVPRQEDYDSLLEAWCDYLELREVMLDDSWFAQTEKDVRLFHEFRHALPVLVNEENSRKGRVKLGTDMAVSHSHLLPLMEFYRDVLEGGGVEYVVFGHLGDNHLHVNLLPQKGEEEKAREVYGRLVEQVLKWGGTVSAEHGIGKLKRDYFVRMVGDRAIQDLLKIKQALDPAWRLGRGNILTGKPASRETPA